VGQFSLAVFLQFLGQGVGGLSALGEHVEGFLLDQLVVVGAPHHGGFQH